MKQGIRIGIDVEERIQKLWRLIIRAIGSLVKAQ